MMLVSKKPPPFTGEGDRVSGGGGEYSDVSG